MCKQRPALEPDFNHYQERKNTMKTHIIAVITALLITAAPVNALAQETEDGVSNTAAGLGLIGAGALLGVIAADKIKKECVRFQGRSSCSDDGGFGKILFVGAGFAVLGGIFVLAKGDEGDAAKNAALNGVSFGYAENGKFALKKRWEF